MDELTVEVIEKKIRNFENSDKWYRLNLLYEYYRGNHKITQMQKPDGKPNNKLVINHAKSIVTNTTGYFLGKPIAYKANDESLDEQIQDIIDYNDDAAVNISIGKNLSVFGIAAELLYIDADLKIRYAKINPMQLIVGTSANLDDAIEYAIRWYDERDDNNARTRHVEVYDTEKISYYATDKNGNALHPEVPQGASGSVEPHYFGQVPVNVYKNNEDETGDFEGVISLIDAYNTMQSESVNDYQKFADAILVLKNHKLPTKLNPETGKMEEVEMRDVSVLNMYEDGDASYLVKQVNDAYVENIKTRIHDDIYIASNTLDMNDQAFAGNASGVAISYKLMPFENRVAETERYFVKGLQRRLELICAILNLRGGQYDYRDIDFTFTRNIPANVADIVTENTQLQGQVSKKTLLSRLPFVTDPDAELEQLEKEQGQYDMSNFGRNDMNEVDEDDTP